MDHLESAEARSSFAVSVVDFLENDSDYFSDDFVINQSLDSVRELLKNLDADQKVFFCRQLRMLFKVTNKIKVEKVPGNAVDLTRLEGQIFSKFLLPFLPKEFKDGEEYAKIIHVLSLLGRTANAFDTFVDLPDDHRNKQIAIEPSMINRVLFLGKVFTDGAEMMKDVRLSKLLIREFLYQTKIVIHNVSERK